MEFAMESTIEHTPRYVAIGHATLDMIRTERARSDDWVCGGNSFFTAVGISIWDGPVGVATRVGSDFPEDILEDFAAAGFNLAGVRRMDQPHLLKGEIVYQADGGRVFFFPEDEKELTPQDSTSNVDAPEIFSEDDYHPSVEEFPPGYWNATGFGLASMSATAQVPFAQALISKKCTFTWDSPDLDGKESLIRPLLADARIFLPSMDDLVWLSGGMGVDWTLETLQGLGPEIIGLKLGADGSCFREAATGGAWTIPAYPADVLDPTGAGDAFCGGFLAGYCLTGDVLEAALRATVSASFVIEGFDARYALGVTREQAEERLQKFRNQVTR